MAEERQRRGIVNVSIRAKVGNAEYRFRMRISQTCVSRAVATNCVLFVMVFSSIVIAPLARAATARAASAAVMPVAAATTVFAQLNVDRKRHGLKAAVRTHRYDLDVTAAAKGMRDPDLSLLPNVITAAGIWGAAATGGSLAHRARSIVNAWVNSDGWSGSQTMNADCTGPAAPGCDSHRDAILSKPPAPGATLSVDVATVMSGAWGRPTMSTAAILVWS
jgi:hypothetical protein